MYHSFVSRHDSVQGPTQHHFLQAEPRKISELLKKLKVDYQIENVMQLRQTVDQIRDGWFGQENKRKGEGYTPSEHDKIKFNINLYLGQMAQFFLPSMSEATALVLDSDDLGSSATLKAFNFETPNIYVPNYSKGMTEYPIMKERVPDLSAFPIGLAPFFKAWGTSDDDASFQGKLMETFSKTKFKRKQKPTLQEPLPTRFKQLDFAYLDYCTMFETIDKGWSNKKTVQYMFKQNVFPRDTPYILAITGSLMFVSNKNVDYLLKRYRNAVLKAARKYGYTRIREDQFFVYHRFHQEGEVEESLAHRNPEEIPDGIKHKEQSHSITMFFMSFVGGVTEKQREDWDALFKICDGGQCKLQFGHRECLYQRGKDRLHLSKPFCNYRITDFYIVDPEGRKGDDFLEKFEDVPLIDDDPLDYLELWNKKSKLPKGILKTFKSGLIGGDIIDIMSIIEMVNSARENGGAEVSTEDTIIDLDETFYIQGLAKKLTGVVSVECILGNIVGIHFTDSDKHRIGGIKDVSSACFLVHVSDLVKHITDEPEGGSKHESSSEEESSSSEEESSSSEEESEESDSEDEESDSELPYDLEYIGDVRLNKLSVQALRQECQGREIDISDGAQKKTCISKLLEWKNSEESEDEEEESELPDDLEYVGESRLSKLSVQQLRQECQGREIDISDGAQKKTCISKLLEWKKAQKTGESKVQSPSASQDPSKVTWKTWLKGEGRQYTKAKCGGDWIRIRSEAYEAAKSPGLTAIAWHEPKVGDFVRMNWLLDDSSYGWFHGEIKKITVRKKKSVITVKWREGGKDKLFASAFLKKNYGKVWNYIRNI